MGGAVKRGRGGKNIFKYYSEVGRLILLLHSRFAALKQFGEYPEQ
jgi:hypothetical protein